MRWADSAITIGSGDSKIHNEANMILLDDNLYSIVDAIEEGRILFKNLKKAVSYSLASSLPKILPFVIAVCFQIPLPLSLSLLLCIDFCTDIVPSIAFAYENPEFDEMDFFPRNV